MADKELVAYIKRCLEARQDEEQIKKALIKVEWKEKEIDLAIASAKYKKESHKPFNKRLLTIFVALATISILSITVIFFIYIQKRPLHPEAENIVKKMMDGWKDVTSCHYRAYLQISGKIYKELDLQICGESIKREPIFESMGIDTGGNLDIGDHKNPQASFSLYIAADKKPTFAGEIITVNRVVYLKPGGLSDLTNLGLFDLSQFRNQWIKIDLNVIKKQLEVKDQKGKLTDKQIEQLKRLVLEKLMGEKRLFKVKQVFEDEVIDSIEAYHYKVALDKKEIKCLVIEAIKILDGGIMARLLGDIGVEIWYYCFLCKIETEIWIGKKDFFLHKVVSRSSFSNEKTDVSFSGNNITSYGTTELFLFCTFSNFNESVSIIESQNFKQFKEVSASLMSSKMSDPVAPPPVLTK